MKIKIIMISLLSTLLIGCTSSKLSNKQCETFGKQLVKKYIINNTQNDTNTNITNDKDRNKHIKVANISKKVIQDISTNITKDIINDNNFQIKDFNNNEIFDYHIYNYKILELVKDNSELEVYTYIKALENTKLLTIYVNLLNKTDKNQSVEKWAKNKAFKLKINNERVILPLNTLLSNELTSTKNTIKPKKSYQAILVYQVKNDIIKNIDKIELNISNNGSNNIIKIKNEL